MTSLANRRSAILLFSLPDCLHSHRTRLVIKEKEISAELHEIDISNISEEIKSISPYDDFPTLVDRELVLQNSRVIIEYLDERFPHPPLLPVDPVARAIGASPGDIIYIERKSKTAITSDYYRYCVNK